jgi:hypothetical protein
MVEWGRTGGRHNAAELDRYRIETIALSDPDVATNDSPPKSAPKKPSLNATSFNKDTRKWLSREDFCCGEIGAGQNDCPASIGDVFTTATIEGVACPRVVRAEAQRSVNHTPSWVEMKFRPAWPFRFVRVVTLATIRCGDRAEASAPHRALLMAAQPMCTAVPPTGTLRDPLGSRTSTRNGALAMPASISGMTPVGRLSSFREGARCG